MKRTACDSTNELKVVARYYDNGEVITGEKFKEIKFSHYVIDKILLEVNERLGLV